MTDSPIGACPHSPGPRPWSSTDRHLVSSTTRETPNLWSSAVNSVRRPASASRTSGRVAGALRALLDTAAYLDAPNNRRRAPRRKINYKEQGVDRPRSFRDDSSP